LLTRIIRWRGFAEPALRHPPGTRWTSRRDVTHSLGYWDPNAPIGLRHIFSPKTAMDFVASGILGVEWFPVDDFSLPVGHGLQLVSSKGVGPGEPVDSPTEPESSLPFNGLQALDITRIGQDSAGFARLCRSLTS
jgi:hypothetical protein